MGSGGKTKVGGAQIDWGDTADLLANHVVNMATANLVGYDVKTGKLKEGYLTHGADEGLGEITGRNQMRQAANEQRDAIDKEKANRQVELQNQQLLDYRADINASSMAQAARTSSDARSSAGSGSSTSSVLGDEKDLLGL